MCEIKNGIIICSRGSINYLQTGNEWASARAKSMKDEKAKAEQAKVDEPEAEQDQE